MLQAGRYLDYARLRDEAPLGATRLLSESRLKVAFKPYALKRARKPLNSILAFRYKGTPPQHQKHRRERDRRE